MVDLKPEFKKFTYVAVSLQEISNQTLDNTEAHRLHHTDHCLPHHPKHAVQRTVPHILLNKYSYNQYARTLIELNKS